MPKGAALISCCYLMSDNLLSGFLFQYVKYLFFYGTKVQKSIDIAKLFMLILTRMY